MTVTYNGASCDKRHGTTNVCMCYVYMHMCVCALMHAIC